jgi:hypothetical protein
VKKLCVCLAYHGEGVWPGRRSDDGVGRRPAVVELLAQQKTGKRPGNGNVAVVGQNQRT